MKPKILKLAGKMLELASDEFSNHGCNDLDDSLFNGWTTEEKQELERDWHKWNGDPEEYDPEYIFSFGDSCLMSYLADKLKEEGKQ